MSVDFCFYLQISLLVSPLATMTSTLIVDETAVFLIFSHLKCVFPLHQMLEENVEKRG